jgi:SAM-dependent MidA family methyltransferase
MTESFASFMARALHDPVLGYYANQIRAVGGSQGDFATSATLSPLLGQAIARWIKTSSVHSPDICDVIEIGAGNGMLMAEIQRCLGWWQRRCFRWHIVENSTILREQQKHRLGKSILWHDHLEQALTACRGHAWIYHNELLDAFPVRLIQYHAGRWHEVYVTKDSKGHKEQLQPLEMAPEKQSHFSAIAWQPATANQRCELHESVYDWLNGWLPLWHSGSILSIDYGDVFPTLYHRRPRGTLRAYFMHQRLEGLEIYERPGRQDLTADINFTDFQQWMESAGLNCGWSGTQADFIHKHVRGASGPMVDPYGAGGAFKIFAHERMK